MDRLVARNNLVALCVWRYPHFHLSNYLLEMSLNNLLQMSLMVP
jgi:hypothetical protein